MSVLTWWLEQRSALAPSEVDALHRALAAGVAIRRIGLTLGRL
jgi:hypothetical protein